jgi:hypothetical protein
MLVLHPAPDEESDEGKIREDAHKPLPVIVSRRGFFVF